MECLFMKLVNYLNFAYVYYEMYIPYLSVLKSGSYTRRGSNIRRVVQQNE